MVRIERIILVILLCVATSAMAPVAFAAALPAGTVIEKSNIDKIKNDTFDGHTIASLLTEKVEWQIRDWGLKITLDHAKPLPVESRLVEATKKYSGRAKFDPATKEVTGYVAAVSYTHLDVYKRQYEHNESTYSCE